MKVPLHIVLARREKLEKLVSAHRYLPLREVCKRLGISEATARRDLVALQKEGRLTRTHGGALSEFNERFPSFNDRQRRSAKAKLAMARAAAKLIVEGGTYFLDSGTTLYSVAEVLAQAGRGGYRVLTVNLPAAELLSGLKDVEVYLTGGQLFQRQSVLLGEAACKSIEGWSFDASFLSSEGMDREGLWNSQLAIVAHQHAVVRRARRNIFLLDRSKLGKRAAHFLLPWPAVDCLLSDAPREEVAALGGRVTHWHPASPPPIEPEPPSASSSLPVHFL
jgi:DeoR/GlpR family transcriptional regulator of sugar metabolism